MVFFFSRCFNPLDTIFDNASLIFRRLGVEDSNYFYTMIRFIWSFPLRSVFYVCLYFLWVVDSIVENMLLAFVSKGTLLGARAVLCPLGECFEWKPPLFESPPFLSLIRFLVLAKKDFFNFWPPLTLRYFFILVLL